MSALQSTVVEEEEDGVIYTVVVKQPHGGPTSPMVRHMWPKRLRPMKRLPVQAEHSLPVSLSSTSCLRPPVLSVALPVRESGDGGETGAAPPPLLFHGRLILRHHLPLHLPLLHLHKESAGHPHRQVRALHLILSLRLIRLNLTVIAHSDCTQLIEVS